MRYCIATKIDILKWLPSPLTLFVHLLHKWDTVCRSPCENARAITVNQVISGHVTVGVMVRWCVSYLGVGKVVGM